MTTTTTIQTRSIIGYLLFSMKSKNAVMKKPPQQNARKSRGFTKCKCRFSLHYECCKYFSLLFAWRILGFSAVALSSLASSAGASASSSGASAASASARFRSSRIFLSKPVMTTLLASRWGESCNEQFLLSSCLIHVWKDKTFRRPSPTDLYRFRLLFHSRFRQVLDRFSMDVYRKFGVSRGVPRYAC